MAVDLRIEEFSIDLFRNVWYHSEVTDKVLPRWRENRKIENTYGNSPAVLEAVLCREIFFQNTLDEILFVDHVIFSRSSIDFYLYLQNHMARFIAFDDINVFEKLFMTCAVVAVMSAMLKTGNKSLDLSSVPLCWAMYFDTEYKDEFYEKGGWTKLEQLAGSQNVELLRWDNLYYSKKQENDFLNAKEMLKEVMSYYLMPVFIAAFKHKTLKGKNATTCLDCRHLFYAGYGISYENEMIPFKYTECYLQFMKIALPKEELEKTEKKTLQNPRFKEISEVFNSVENPSEDSRDGVLEFKTEFYEQLNDFKNSLRALNTYKLLDKFFITDSERGDQQCVFCGIDLNRSTETLKSTSDFQVQRIKTSISEMLTDVAGKYDPEEGASFEIGESQRPNKKVEGMDEVLRLFYTLGIKPATSDMLANLKKAKKEKPLTKITHTYPEALIQEVEKKKKKKSKKKNKNVSKN